MMPNELHVTHLPCHNGQEFSLIIPNVSTQGPPTSSAVQVNQERSGADHRPFPAIKGSSPHKRINLDRRRAGVSSHYLNCLTSVTLLADYAHASPVASRI